jgi:hypothetical protein
LMLYTLSQNGMVERENRTLCEMARMMPDEHMTLRRFWAEAVNPACYVSNRIYLRVYKKKTCYELMHGRTPVDGIYSYQSSYGFASGQIPRRSQGGLTGPRNKLGRLAWAHFDLVRDLLRLALVPESSRSFPLLHVGPCR